MDLNQNNQKLLFPLIRHSTKQAAAGRSGHGSPDGGDEIREQLQSEMSPNHRQERNQRRNINLKNPKLWIGLVFLLVIVVTIISLILYSNVYIDEDEKRLTNLSSNSTCSYTGFFNVSNPCLWNLWIKNESLFQEKITSAYSLSPSLNYFFIAAKVDYNSIDEEKSAVIHLDFTQPSKSMKYPISTELVGGILRQNLYKLQKSACEDTQILKDSLQVYVTSI
ncbi:TPA-induced transmembrane protein isoform 2-T2 [Leptodactylus fuscus]|uniref:TPA-induced transmembrane protein isoform X2 n=1 Tax=Leptodactylus fuscus TaxID=238119 RepID=UPI003F4F38DD